MSSDKEQLQQKCAKLVNNSFVSDVVFTVGKKAKLIYGHRVPLVHISEVFNSILCGPNKSKRNHKYSLIVDDVEPDIFLEMLNFIYCDQCDITQCNVMGMLHVADKYKLYELEQRCNRFLTENDCTGVVLEAFINSHPQCYRMTELCLKQICSNPFRVFRHSLFMTLSTCLLRKIVDSKSIRCSDHQLLKAVEHWKDHQPESERNEINHICRIIKDRIDNVPKNRDYGGKRMSMLKSIEEMPMPHFNGQLTASRDLHLYGIGVYAGMSVQHGFEANANVQISLGAETIVKDTFQIDPTDDDSVQDCFFRRVRLHKGQKIDLDVTLLGKPHSSQFMWYNCIREGMRCVDNGDFEFQNGNSESQLSPIAYVLYDIID